ncbi:DUF4238 domain-containing protein [Cohnella xylanilytica]|uniref:DUF4238 domain-containing protein n=1 Tax=Cohnella xylanilytica TaxID=557555 RepID=A0A841TVJ5_9BACL|nr:DUF4238 domain-containing protein [Cohnella xylanilytica]MBB6691048.1 DUF4238 domain-containing protein [Cohnella xylanilytica]
MSGGQNEKRRHHYVPVFHLSGFTKKGNRESPLFVFNTETGSQFESKPERIGFERNLYTVDLPDVQPDAIEDVFADLEDKTAPVVRTLCETLQLPDGDDYNFLMNYIALLEVRTPIRRRIFADFMEQVAKITLQEVVATEERFEGTRQRMAADGQEVPKVSYQDLRDFAFEERYTVSFDNNTHVRNVLDTMDAVLHPLGARNWSVIYSPETLGDFICSDHPVSLHWLEEKERGFFSSPGHGRLDTEVTVPLTSRVLLLGRFQPFMPKRIVLKSRLHLAYLNSYSSMNCERFIFSRKEDFVWFSRENKVADVSDFRRIIAEDRNRSKKP